MTSVHGSFTKSLRHNFIESYIPRIRCACLYWLQPKSENGNWCVIENVWRQTWRLNLITLYEAKPSAVAFVQCLNVVLCCEWVRVSRLFKSLIQKINILLSLTQPHVVLNMWETKYEISKFFMALPWKSTGSNVVSAWAKSQSIRQNIIYKVCFHIKFK